MKPLTVKVSEADLEWLSEQHWKRKMSRAAYASALLEAAIAAERLNEDRADGVEDIR